MVRCRFVLGLAVALSLYVWCPVRPVVVLGRSMEPTLHSGQVVLVHRSHYSRHPLRRGDIVVFRYDGMVQVKRIHALPGQRVWEVHYQDSEDTVFLLEARTLSRARHLLGGESSARITSREVPPGSLYLLGDGGNASYDSRHYGTVPASAVIGKVILSESADRAAAQALNRATIQVGG